MDRTNILILSANWRADLVYEFKRALAETCGGKIVAADMSPLSSALFAADEYEIVPPLASPGFVDRLITVCRRHNISAVIPSIDKDLPVLARIKDRLAQAGVTAVVSDLHAVQISDDKYLTYQFLREHGFPVPATWLPEEFSQLERRPKFPLLLKPRRGIGGKGIVKVEDEEALRFFLRRVEDPIVQEFLPGREFSFDTLSDLEGRPLSVVPRERLYVRDGEVFKGRTVLNMEFINLVAAVAEALRLKGPAVIQGLEDADGRLRLTEVNPRFGSGVLLSIAAGADYATDLVRLIRGERLRPYLGRFTDGLYILRYYQAFFATEYDLPK